jgi:hypothetical protein
MKIEFTMDNDSFVFDRPGEIATILYRITEDAAYDDKKADVIHDINGNRIGQWIVED